VAVRRQLRKVALRVPVPGRDQLLRLGWRGYESYLTRRSEADSVAAGATRDGPPIPPPKLRVLVVGTADTRFFIESGRAQTLFIRETLGRHGSRIEDLPRILDLGCGCGRLARWWHDLPAAVSGSDFNPELSAWCAANLPFMEAASNELEPPLTFAPSRQFDFIYAWSVFTHLSEGLQRLWLKEIRRRLEPGGRFLFTVSGAHHRDHLTRREREVFDRGELVEQFQGASGSNLCATFHPSEYVERHMLEGFTLLEATPGKDQRFMHQDAYLLQRDQTADPAPRTIAN
jgi:SAM-dependent methyltransferase